MTSKYNAIVAKAKNNEPRIDSRLIAGGLGVSHNHLIEQIEKYSERLKFLVIVRFETEKLNSGRGRHESIHHNNLEKMINKALRVPAGSRKQLPPATRSAIAVAERIASVACEEALHTGQDHKAAYQKAKTGVVNYAKTVVPILPILECD